MSSVSTFGTFTMAKLGIYASQKALDATGNNIANVNTPGYTRQRIDQYSMYMGGADRYAARTGAMSVKIGNGAMVDGVSQLRDKYLDIRYRNEQSSVGAMDKKLDVLSQLASILDEVGDGTDGEGVLEAQFNDLMTQLQNLANPNIGTGREVADTLVRSAAFAVTKTFNQYAERLETLRQTQEDSFQNDVDRVNDILESIRDLNKAIRKSQIHGSDCLEQQDERNNLIDELSQYIRISVTTEQEDLGDGWMVDKLVIKLNGNEQTDPNNTNSATLIDGIYGTQLQVKQVKVDANGNPIKDANGKPVEIYSAEKQADTEYSETYDIRLSELKDCHGLSQKEKTLVDPSGTGFNKDGYKTKQEAEDALKAGAGTITKPAAQTAAEIEKAQQEFSYDEPKVVKGDDGKYYIKCLRTATSVKKDLADNTLYGSLQTDREMLYEQGEFSTNAQVKIDTNALTKRGIPYYQKSLDALANQFAALFNDLNTAPEAGGKPLFSNDGRTDNTTNPKITAMNISISQSWSNSKGEDGGGIITTTQKGDGSSTANDNVAKMLSQFMNGSIEFKPSHGSPDGTDLYVAADGSTDKSFFSGPLQGMLMNTWEVMSSDAKTTNDMYNNYNTSLDELYVNRDAVSGVDLNDEAMNMMQYQKSYSAACRLLTTIDELIDKLVNGTGRAGL